MNIGEIRKNANGQLIGSVETLTITRTIGLRPVTSSNPRAPKYEIVALNDQRRWVIVGALFELSSNSTGESFYQGKIDDPSMAQPLYIAAFPREDGTMAVAWQRPRRRSSQLGSAEYGENDIFPPTDITEDWLHLIDHDAENVVKVSPVRAGSDTTRAPSPIV